MSVNDKSISINPLPFILLGLILVAIVFGANLWDKYRLTQKFTKLEINVERIYQARREQFIEIAKLNDPKLAYTYLTEIRAPESKLYGVNVYVRRGNLWYLVTSKYNSKSTSYDSADLRQVTTEEAESLERLTQKDVNHDTKEKWNQASRFGGDQYNLIGSRTIRDEANNILGVVFLLADKNSDF